VLGRLRVTLSGDVAEPRREELNAKPAAESRKEAMRRGLRQQKKNLERPAKNFRSAASNARNSEDIRAKTRLVKEKGFRREAGEADCTSAQPQVRSSLSMVRKEHMPGERMNDASKGSRRVYNERARRRRQRDKHYKLDEHHSNKGRAAALQKKGKIRDAVACWGSVEGIIYPNSDEVRPCSTNTNKMNH